MSVRCILAAVGTGPESELAIAQADELARAHGARLLVCHASPHEFFHAASGPDTRARLAGELRAYVGRLTGRTAGEYEVEVREGRTHAAVLELAERCAAECIVVGAGSEGSGAVSDSELRRILRHAAAPVWIARGRTGTRRVLVGTDFSDPALPAVAAAAAESRRIGGELTILHSLQLMLSMPVWSATGPVPIDIPPAVQAQLHADVEERLAAALAQCGAAGQRRVAHGSPAQALLAAARELEADLVVTGTLGRTGIPRVLIGSVAEEVALGAPCSVLVVRLAHV
ncbi:MAG: universal stress protein [Planctomycetes bacterium]|nr:universal stress protein [Planctomycetota bacterium]